MERAHVLVRLRGEACTSPTVGICRTSPTTVRLEHSDMSPGVASITFEQVFDVNDSNSRVFQQSLTPAIDDVVEGKAATLIATGATGSGKSFACHGDQQKPSSGKAGPGLITLAIRRVFGQLEANLKNGGKCNVLLSCCGVRRSGSSENEALVDLLTATTRATVLPMENMEDVLVEHSVVVSTPAEAVHLYSRALGRVTDAGKQDFVLALHVETLLPDGEARRGRLVVVDIHGGSIVEPHGRDSVNQAEKKRGQQYLLDTQFPVHEPLSAAFVSAAGHHCLHLHHSGEPALSPSLSPSTSCESEESQKQSVVSRRVRKAYDIAKAATSSSTKASTPFDAKSNQCDETAIQIAIDALLKHLPHDTLRGLSLQTKLEHIRTSQLDLERALVHETSIKDKCVDRISRLSQTMSCQVVEHEQQLQEALTAKHAAEAKLQGISIKFGGVGREVARLQEEVKALKAGQKIVADNEDTQSSSSERVMLHTLSARLEEAMIQAKDVITFKDSVIESLEERLQLASKRGADVATLLEDEKNRFEREKTELLTQLQQNKESKSSKCSEEVSRIQAENMLIQQQKADLTVKVAQLTLELETARSQWAQDAREREDRAEQRCANQVGEAEQKLEQATASMQHQMAQFRNELDMKVARQRVATQVACKAGELRRDQLERELQRMKVKLAKQKVKLEKKARALVANAHKQHEEPVAVLERELEGLSARMETVLKREHDALTQAKKSEKSFDQLKAQVQQLQSSAAELERERAALGNLCQELETDKSALKTELGRRTREMEQSLAEQVTTAEARVHEQRDRQMQKMVEQHNAELNRLKTIIVEKEKPVPKPTELTRQQSSSPVSPRSSSSGEDGSLSSDSSHQQSIDELDALIDSKERRYRQLEKRRKAGSLSPPSSSPTRTSTSSLKRALSQKQEEITELAARQKQLLAALATANEQETLAKNQNQEIEARCQKELARYEELLQQLNSVKQENWNLSLALHVTEATNQQHQRGPPRGNSMY
uniref:Kinesin motor domain-containing protein n=1 Tax=Phytophthora ramorum TaxID=164328 RepID=H3GLG5_PHYRM